MVKKSTLYEMLVEDLSEARASRFLKGFAQRSDIVYKEAEITASDDAVIKDYVPYFNGQVLFYLHQSMFLKLAADCNLDHGIRKCEQNGFPSAVVKIGRFHFTDHHGETSNEVNCLNPSLMRAQNSLINLGLLQGNLFERPFDGNKLRGADDIYGNFVHGCRGTGSTFATYGFMRIAFPSVTNVSTAEEAQKKLRYVEKYDLYDVLEDVLSRETQNPSVAQPRVRVAPKIKKEQ